MITANEKAAHEAEAREPSLSTPLLRAQDLVVQRGAHVLCERITFDIEPHTCWVIIGPNGVGKSTLLLTLAGLLSPMSGQIELCGASLASLNVRERAQRRTFLGAQPGDAFSTTVFDAVLAGRHPHLAAWQWESAADMAVAEDALKCLDLIALATRDVRTLSAGERQRVALATVLAQNAPLYLLDEPASHLDPAQQVATLDALMAQARSPRTAMVMVLHELHLATRYADFVILMGDEQAQIGTAKELLTIEKLSALFHAPMTMLEGDDLRSFVPVRGQGSGRNGQSMLPRF